MEDYYVQVCNIYMDINAHTNSTYKYVRRIDMYKFVYIHVYVIYT